MYFSQRYCDYKIRTQNFVFYGGKKLSCVFYFSLLDILTLFASGGGIGYFLWNVLFGGLTEWFIIISVATRDRSHTICSNADPVTQTNTPHHCFAAMDETSP